MRLELIGRLCILAVLWIGVSVKVASAPVLSFVTTTKGIGPFPFGVATADFDADGSLDLAVTDVNAARVSILLGNGDGTFGGPAHYGTGATCRGVTAGDLNGDGRRPLLSSSPSSAGAGDGIQGAYAAPPEESC